MFDWIVSDEKYTELYHQIFNEFIENYFDSGYFSEMLDTVEAMISPYVEKDPSKFCTYEEFKTGVSVLKEFCLLRAESVKSQLNGAIGTTSATQKTETLIDASHINTSDMGSMGMGGGKGEFGANTKKPQGNSDSSAEKPSDNSDISENNSVNNSSQPQMPEFSGNGMPPEFSAGENGSGQNGPAQRPDSVFSPSNEQTHSQPQSTISTASLMLIGISVLLLLAGFIFALYYKKRK